MGMVPTPLSPLLFFPGALSPYEAFQSPRFFLSFSVPRGSHAPQATPPPLSHPSPGASPSTLGRRPAKPELPAQVTRRGPRVPERVAGAQFRQCSTWAPDLGSRPAPPV